MKLHIEDNKYFIRGFYNKGEESFISRYFIGYGENILGINPLELSNLICMELTSLQTYHYSIPNNSKK